MWQENNPYGASSSQAQPAYYQAPAQEPLQFYSGGLDPNSYAYPGSRPSLDEATQGSISQSPGFGGNIQSGGGWWTAFGTGGFEGEPPLLQELGINFSHIRAKSLTVLNPLQTIDNRIMDDADLAGPIIFFFCFGISLLFSGKPNFGYIYGVGLFGSVSMYLLLNLMSARGIDAYRVASVLGYCLLPMVGVGLISVMIALDGTFGYLLTILSILWCTYAASGIFVAVLQMSEQRLLVAYPVGLLYGCFALLTVFSVTDKSS
ncbi:Yip1 domain family protein [Coprinopsis cinerea okayama7|uniref:Protein YIP n=1 Tax=Coprinopsis cinerea (strain Okayama-7 / 130 / ATCC MYA-4618 / FGSC 9003) TaxID=240176 RepID=A8N5I9_COPC7|nr:Yip1 domain family protein [Coprinopsis cinerea okayama7\|eukprot:XP_001830134.1 Yip1 domain family protein [Coprinopsis cinerea okayama7\